MFNLIFILIKFEVYLIFGVYWVYVIKFYCNSVNVLGILYEYYIFIWYKYRKM